MTDRAERIMRFIFALRSKGVTDERVLHAMEKTDRAEFVRGTFADRAYDDMPLPIECGQTISQPTMVGIMTQAANAGPRDTVLEIGTGSGYQAAILAELVRHVVTIEIIEPLARSAAERLARLGFRNVSVFRGDGYFGHESAAPYDAIIVTAAARHVPPPLIAQLEPGGRMVIPVGRTAWTQNLLLVEKDAAGDVRTRNLLPVSFVPLTGDH